ncbi:MAG: hypothetical protein J7641_11635 [Cyanobacteria bacterium SID2]|nr:hypothetical protein [Cyanobacteria bacterium SID2]MBP0005623.1 hypothetical protein [Cyanobacteria bacterium SBC]
MSCPALPLLKHSSRKMRSPDRLQIAEYLCWISTIVGTLVAAVSGRIAFLGAPMSLSLFLNLTNRHRLAVMTHRRAMTTIVRVHQQLSYELQRLNERVDKGLPESSTAALPNLSPHQGAPLNLPKRQDTSAIARDILRLQAGYENLYESLSETIEYLNDSPVPQRLNELEAQVASLTDEIDRLEEHLMTAVAIDVEQRPISIAEIEDEEIECPDCEGELDDRDSVSPAFPENEEIEEPPRQTPTASRSLHLPLEMPRESSPLPNLTPKPSPAEETAPSSFLERFSIEGRSLRVKESPTLPLSGKAAPPNPPQETGITEPPTPATNKNPFFELHPPSSETVGLPNFLADVPQQSWASVFTLTDHGDWVSALVVAPDNETLISASFDRTIQLWKLKTGESTAVLSEHTSPVCALAVSPDGRLLVSGSWDKTIELWDLNELRKEGSQKNAIETLTDDTTEAGSVRSLTVSPDGQFIASGWFEGSIRVWQVKVSPKRKRISAIDRGLTTGHRGRVDALAFSPDGEILASAGADGSIILWAFDRDTGQRQRQHVLSEGGERPGVRDASPINALAFSLDGRTLVSANRDRVLQLWDLQSGQCQQVLQEHAGSVTDLAVCPDGKTIVSGSADGTVKVWNVSHGCSIATLSDSNDAVMAVAVSPDGETIVSGNADGTVKVWRKQPDEEMSQ